MAKKIQSITGMNDILPQQVTLWQFLESKVHEIFSRYGYSEIRVPLMEHTPLFARGMGEGSQVVQKEMYTFEDRGGESVTLRPEGTAGVVRAYVQNSLSAKDAISKLYYLGAMFRYERPQKGRLRQFHQVGVELLGVDSPHADAEVVIMLDRLVKDLGIQDYTIEVNSLGTLQEREQYLDQLKQYFSGHVQDLCEDCKERLQKNPLRILDCKVNTCQKIAHDAPVILEALSEQTQSEFQAFCKALEEAQVAYHVQPKIVRGLDYYQKTAFEFTSTKLGSQSAFAGGGRYNQLVEELGGVSTPAVGFAMGCERVVMLLEQQQDKKTDLTGVYFASLSEAAFAKARELLQEVRDQGIKADMDFTFKSLKSQMRRANKLGFGFVAILGDDELSREEVVLKNLESGEQEAVAFVDLVKGLAKS